MEEHSKYLSNNTKKKRQLNTRIIETDQPV